MKLRALYAFLVVIGTSLFYPSIASADGQDISTPINLRIQVENNEVLLKWNNPGEGVTAERFAVMWQTSTANGWGVATQDKSIALPMEVITSTAGSGIVYFSVRADNDTLHIYSSWSNQVTLELNPIVDAPSPAPSPSQSPTPEASPSSSPQPVETPSPEPISIEPAPPAPISLPAAPVAPPVAVEPQPEPIAPIPPEVPPVPEPAPIVEPEPQPKPIETPAPEPAPQPIPAPVAGLIPNNPNSLPESTPKIPENNLLTPHIQEDKAGIENGGIEFFGTQAQPQVIGEDGKLTPPPPLPGSGDPIPPDAITTADTFIGQAGGVTFNAPDVAVPVMPIEVNINIPGVGAAAQSIADAYVAMANIGNDMSPVTRKKAKKILVTTILGGAILRRMK